MTIQKEVVTTRGCTHAIVGHMKEVDTILMIMIRNCVITTTADREKEKKSRGDRGMSEVVVTEIERMEISVEMSDITLKTKTAGEMTGVAQARTRINLIAKTFDQENSQMDMNESEVVIVRMTNELQGTANHQDMILSQMKNEVSLKKEKNENQDHQLLKVQYQKRRKP